MGRNIMTFPRRKCNSLGHNLFRRIEKILLLLKNNGIILESDRECHKKEKKTPWTMKFLALVKTKGNNNSLTVKKQPIPRWWKERNGRLDSRWKSQAPSMAKGKKSKLRVYRQKNIDSKIELRQN